MDEFKDIPGCEGYKANRLGQVKGKRGMILKPATNKYGYHHVTICNDGERRHLYVHRIVGYTFLDNPENLAEIDNNPGNNCVDNLRWITQADNHNRQDRIVNAKCYSQTKYGFKVQYRIEGKEYTKCFKQEQDAINYVAYLKLTYPR